jgi:ABC-type Fe3+ transport system substrate-binding protein
MRGFIILLACLLAAGAARAAERTPALQKLVEDAAKQGEIDLVWSQSTLGGTRGAAAFEAGLNKMFGTKLRIKFTPGPSMPTVGNEIAMRQLAGQPAQTDAYIGFSRDLSDMVAKDLFRSVAWTGLMPARITPAVVDANGTMVKTVTGLLGVTYNTALAPAKPEYLRDFLAPGWKGKIATTPYSAGFDVLAAKDLWGPEKALDYARALSGQIAGLIRCDDNERIASGEFLALVIDCGGSDIFNLTDHGAPIAHFTPRDYPMLSYYYLAVPKNAPHAAAGTLFVAFAATPEGQRIVWDGWHGDLHLYPESHMHQRVAEIEQRFGEKLHDIDIAWQMGNVQGRTVWRDINKVLAAGK